MTTSRQTDGRKMSGRDVSRREFVRGAAGVLVGGLVLTTGFHQLEAGVAAAGPVLGRAGFEKSIGERFRLSSAAVSTLDLFKVRDLRFAQPGEDSYSLLFRGPSDPGLEQGVYTLENRRTGKFTVLLVPMRPEPDARYYEAIFNRAAPR
jgi:hypothetical protein